jgi:hypothetical protein
MEDLRKSPAELRVKLERARTWAAHFEGKDWGQWVLFMEELVAALAGLHDVEAARAEMARVRDASMRLEKGEHADWMGTLAMGHHHLAVALHQRREVDAAIAEYRNALRTWDRRAAVHAGDAVTAGLMATALARVGELLVEKGDLDGVAKAVVTSIEVHRRAGADAAEVAWRVRFGRAWFEKAGDEGGARALTEYLAAVPLQALPDPSGEERAATGILRTMGMRLAGGFAVGDLAVKYGSITGRAEGRAEFSPHEPTFASGVVANDVRRPELAATVTLRRRPERELTLSALRAAFGDYQQAPEGSPFAPEVVSFRGGEGDATYQLSAEPEFLAARRGSRSVEKIILFL